MSMSSSSSSSSSDSESEEEAEAAAAAAAVGGAPPGGEGAPRYCWMYINLPRCLLQQTLKEFLEVSEGWEQQQQQQQQQQKQKQQQQVDSYAEFLAKMAD
ncbi:hypothetical protein, conserved [Eimeria brunetti]|uniref:Uncharacterized protein n=1 Tax=Eimeria brunetti TaxID=51314 RepID=U6LUF4_9EIME|nr:hypothetical protein, conserved [Eimeria brunetti]